MPGGPGGPDQAPPSEEDRASEGARVVASKEQNPCVDKAGVEVRLELLQTCLQHVFQLGPRCIALAAKCLDCRSA